MEFQEFKGKTVEEALTEASIALETTSDNIEYEVVLQESSGFLGIGKKDAIIKARRKDSKEETVLEEVKEEVKEEPAKEEPKEVAVSEPVKEAVKEAVKEEKVLDTTPVDAEKVKAFVESVIAKMGIDGSVEVNVDEEEKCVNVNVEGPDTGDIIGKRGQTLDSIQYLTSIIANKGKADYYRIKLDTKNYRERRQKTLENLAKNCAYKCKKTRRKVVLDPMNPYERRIIHSYLQNDSQIETKSEGVEPNRKVIIYYKR